MFTTLNSLPFLVLFFIFHSADSEVNRKLDRQTKPFRCSKRWLKKQNTYYSKEDEKRYWIVFTTTKITHTKMLPNKYKQLWIQLWKWIKQNRTRLIITANMFKLLFLSCLCLKVFLSVTLIVSFRPYILRH